MALRVVRVAVVGCPSGLLDHDSLGVGKSALCNRFLHNEGYCEDHPSRVSVQEWEGSVINQDHFLYWGATTKFCASTGRVRFQVLEYTEFINEETGRVFPFRTDYIGRACEPFKSARKCAYEVGQVSGPEEPCDRFLRRRSSGVTTQVLFEEGQTEVSGYLCAFDPSLSEESGALQRQIDFLLRLLEELCKLRKPIVIACTKCDSSDATRDSIRTGKAQLTAKRRHIPFLETSARESVNIEEAFFTLVLNMKRNRKTMGPLFVKKGGTSHSEPSTYKEVEYSRRKELRKARSAFQEVLNTHVVDFDKYWMEARAELEGQAEYQRLLELTDLDTLRKMFCNRLMEIKLQQASQSFEKVRSCPSLSAYISGGSSDCMEERMKYSQAVLKDAVASHPDLDSSVIYDFIRPSQSVDTELGRDKAVEERDQNGHEVDRLVGRRSTFAISNSNTAHEQPLPQEDQGSDTDQEAPKEGWKPFKHRSKSYMLSRGNKIKGNASPEKMPTLLQQEKKDWSHTIAAFGTLPHRGGKKKKSKKATAGDKVYVTAASDKVNVTASSEARFDFEDYGQYSEENPPPLPPRPHELPPLQSSRHAAQLSVSADSSGLTLSGSHKALEASRIQGSVDLLHSCDWEEESNLDLMQNDGGAASQGDASPYEVPVALKVSPVRKAEAPQPSPVYTTVRKAPGSFERSTTELNSTVSHASFSQPTSTDENALQKIGLRRLIRPESPSHPLVSPSTSKKTATAPRKSHFRGHRRADSYDPSLLRLVRAVDPPTLPHLSQQIPAKSVSSVRPVPQLPPWNTGKSRLHASPHNTSHLDSSMHQYSSTRFPSPQPGMPDAVKLEPPPENMHSRQSSLPDSLNYNGAPGEGTALLTGPHHSQSLYTSGSPALDHTRQPHTLQPRMPRSHRLPTEVRGSFKSSSECVESDMGPSPKSSSEEREYTMVPRSPKENVFAFPEEGGRDFRKRRSTHSDDGNLYEQIDDYAVQYILGQDGIPSPFPQPFLLSEANLDAAALREIQQWHMEFMKVYTHWMRNLDSILRSCEQRHADRKEERPDRSHKDSGTSTSLSREDLTVPLDGPTQEPPPPSVVAVAPTPTAQPSTIDSQPSGSGEPPADTALPDDTTPSLPSAPASANPNGQPPVVHSRASADSGAELKNPGQEQSSEKTAAESGLRLQEVMDEGGQQHIINIVSRSEHQVLYSERTATYESRHHHQPQYETRAGHMVKQPTTAAPFVAPQREQLTGEHTGGYDRLVGYKNILQNGASFHSRLPSPRKVSLV